MQRLSSLNTHFIDVPIDHFRVSVKDRIALIELDTDSEVINRYINKESVSKTELH